MVRFNIFNSQGTILFLILLILISYTDNIKGTPSSDLKTVSDCQISGIINDVSTMAVIDNAKISLLDPFTGDVLYTDIYTDRNGSYDATINLNFTHVPNESAVTPSSYQISEFHPNPVSSRYNETLTIQYQVPYNVPETPALEMYNILGRKVNHEAYLTSGIYICRLRFNNGHFSESRKLMWTSGGYLRLSLNQVFGNIDQTLRNTKSDMSLTKEADDILEVLFMIEKAGYACMERSANWFRVSTI